LYAGILYAIYRLNNADLLMVFITLSLMIPIIFLIVDKYQQAQVIDHLQQETLKAELNLLKSQINPHFFFNTLNNLYGLAIAKSDLAPEVIHKLAQMMRFTIYDGRKDSVSVAEEIAYLENFIELNQIRQQHKIAIQFHQNIENPEQRIPPLLFINLLENAFKHGVETLSAEPFIEFTLSTNSKAISFAIENNFDAQVLEKNKRQRGQGGLGTENVQRRLALLFPNKHQYRSEAIGNRYRAEVRIDLS
jgi:LytS/YehU family sensor histidine kinase